MNYIIKTFLSSVVVFMLVACPSVFVNRDGQFLEACVNLEKFNSEFDDYNSNLPQNRYGSDYLLFSSKRARKNVFNLVVKPFDLQYDEKAKTLNATDWIAPNYSIAEKEIYYKNLAAAANQDCNVLGPALYELNRWSLPNNASTQHKYILLYADDLDGHLQIKFVHNCNDKNKIEGPFEVSWLNSRQNDAYPTFDRDFNKLYFCSDRNGNFDIFEVALPTDKSKLLETLLSKTPLPVTKNEQFSSPGNDKCPHFDRSVLYFVSDRPGGVGGFDIYYAKYNGAQWSNPKNIGSRINTPSDEYRPTTLKNSNFSYPLGIFSSNRPNGKGGFDLYMTGLLTEADIRL